jgi:cytochrome oxidase assembly protein ShyY1
VTGGTVHEPTASGSGVAATVDRVRFLFSRRWLLFGLAVVVLAYGCYLLGEWQFHRLHEREARNAQTTTNLAAAPAPVDAVLRVGAPLAATEEWRQVRATGEYVDEETVVVRYQTRDGKSGVDLVTPLRIGDGPAVLVDRGWVATGNSGNTRPDVPPAPAGQVTVVGWLRADATGDSARVEDRSTRAVSSAEIGKTLPFPVYGGWVDAEHETPPPANAPARAEPPDLGDGPHFFYGLQWWFFGLLAVFGFGYLAYDERRKAGQSERSRPPSTGTMAPVMNDAAGESRKAAARPNSSGSP